MKILETRTAPNPRRVRIFLAEKGIEVPYEEVDIMKGVHKQEAFTRANPMQRVPVLVLDDGTAIAETVAICRYFEETKPEPALFGKGAVGRATVEMWNRRMEIGLMAHVAAAFRHIHPAAAVLEQPQFKDFGEASKGRAVDALKVMDDALGKTRFVAGNEYSIADVTGLCAIDFMRPAKIALPPEMKNIARWHAEVSARPSAKA
jgi:glutathione S-transferase